MMFPVFISTVMVMIFMSSTTIVHSLRIPKALVATHKWMKTDHSSQVKNTLKLTNDPFSSYNDVFRPHAHTSNDHNPNERHISTELQSSSLADVATTLRFEESNPMNPMNGDFSESPSLGLDVDTEHDTFIESLEFAKSFVDTATTLIRGDIIFAMCALIPFLANAGHMISSSFLENDLFANTVIPAMALYLGNILFLIFL